MPTEQEILDYLGIDIADEMVSRNIARCAATAEGYLKGAVGTPLPTDPRVKEAALMIIDRLYSVRGLPQKTECAANRLFDGILMQLRLEVGESYAV